jgi:hypothetical protein
MVARDAPNDIQRLHWTPSGDLLRWLAHINYCGRLTYLPRCPPLAHVRRWHITNETDADGNSS